MPLTSPISDYDETWPSLFAGEVLRLAPVFGDAPVDLHHVGSTAVPGLAAKPEIDILAVVSGPMPLERWRNDLLDLGYRRGTTCAATPRTAQPMKR